VERAFIREQNKNKIRAIVNARRIGGRISTTKDTKRRGALQLLPGAGRDRPVPGAGPVAAFDRGCVKTLAANFSAQRPSNRLSVSCDLSQARLEDVGLAAKYCAE
jgi:hypothetical protein